MLGIIEQGLKGASDTEMGGLLDYDVSRTMLDHHSLPFSFNSLFSQVIELCCVHICVWRSQYQQLK